MSGVDGLTGLFSRSGDNSRSPGRRVSFAPKTKIREFQEQSGEWNENREQEPDPGWEFEIPDLYSVRRISQISELRVSLGGAISGESYEMDLKTSSPFDVAAMSSSSSNKENAYKSEHRTSSETISSPPHAVMDKDLDDNMNLMKETDDMELSAHKFKSISQIPKLDKNDSVSIFFANAREHSIDIVTSPTLPSLEVHKTIQSNSDKALASYGLETTTQKMRKSASDMSIQMDPYSPSRLREHVQYDTPIQSPKENSNPYVTSDSSIIPKVKSSGSSFYRNDSARISRFPHLSTPTKLRVAATPTLDLCTTTPPKQTYANINTSEPSPIEFENPQWLSQSYSYKKYQHNPEVKAPTVDSVSTDVDLTKKDLRSSYEKTLRDDFFDQFNGTGENIMHERLPSYDTILQERPHTRDGVFSDQAAKSDINSRSPLQKRTINLENLLKSMNIDLSDEFPYAFNKEEFFYYLPKNLECCNIEKLVLLMLPKLSYTESECLRLQDVIAKARSNVGRLIKSIELNPPPIFYEIFNHNNREAREVKDALKITHIFSVNEAEAGVYLRHSDSINAFHRSMAQILPSLQSDESKIKAHLYKFTKKLKTVKEFNDIIRENINTTKKKIEERKLEQESERAELSRLCNSKQLSVNLTATVCLESFKVDNLTLDHYYSDYLRSLMEKNVSSQQNINDSSEIDKLNTELKHVQSCICDIDKKYDEIRQFSTKRLRALGREHDLVHITLPWKVVHIDKSRVTLLYMGVLMLNIVREKLLSLCVIKIKLANQKIGALPEYANEDNYAVIDIIGSDKVSSVLLQIERDLFTLPVPVTDVKKAMMVVEALWSQFQQLYFDFGLVKSRFDASIVQSQKNSLGIKVNYFFIPKKTRVCIIFWRVLHPYCKAGSQHDLKIECGSLMSAGEVSTRISQLESRLGPDPSIVDLIEGIATA